MPAICTMRAFVLAAGKTMKTGQAYGKIETETENYPIRNRKRIRERKHYAKTSYMVRGR